MPSMRPAAVMRFERYMIGREWGGWDQNKAEGYNEFIRSANGVT